jgi:hypothetical protein
MPGVDKDGNQQNRRKDAKDGDSTRTHGNQFPV